MLFTIGRSTETALPPVSSLFFCPNEGAASSHRVRIPRIGSCSPLLRLSPQKYASLPFFPDFGDQLVFALLRFLGPITSLPYFVKHGIDPFRNVDFSSRAPPDCFGIFPSVQAIFGSSFLPLFFRTHSFSPVSLRGSPFQPPFCPRPARRLCSTSEERVDTQL